MPGLPRSSKAAAIGLKSLTAERADTGQGSAYLVLWSPRRVTAPLVGPATQVIHGRPGTFPKIIQVPQHPWITGGGGVGSVGWSYGVSWH